MPMKRIFALLTFLLLTACTKNNYISIGTGAVTGVFYPTGGAICRLVNARSKVYKIKATAESTAGSVFNVNSVLTGELDFGIVQSDRHYQAYHGLAEWKEAGPQKELRSVFSIHPEAVTLVVTEKSGILTPTDLKGHTVNLGNPGSGPLQNARDVLQLFDIDEEEDIHAEYVKALEAPSLLQDERIDAFFYTVGHPNGAIKEATAGRLAVRFVPIKGKMVDELLDRKPYYRKTRIETKLYPRILNESDVETVGVKATLITSVHVDDDLVYAVTREVFENLAQFKTMHPSYAALTREKMLAGLTAPIHNGALKYYRESGLIQYIETDE
jgi:TRAP transporter TAXI family solute receptor